MKIFEGTVSTVLISKEILQLFGLAGIGYFLYTGLYQYLVIGLVFRWFLDNIVHHIGLHRYFAHSSFKTNKFWHVFLCLTSPLVCAGSTIGYAVVHRAHHAYTDKELDPHSPKFLGFIKVVMTRWDYKGVTSKFFRNLNDPWVVFAHRWYLLIIIIFCIILSMINPLLLLAYCVSVVYGKFTIMSINYFSHIPVLKINYRNFETNDNSQNNLVAGWILGEWHNNHHARPGDWNQRIRWWEWDIPTLIIWAIKK